MNLPDYYRPITGSDIEPVKPEDAVGPTLSMKWIPIEKLVVDTRYQRDIAKGLKSNVRQIGARFKWRRFAPVIVTRIEGTDFYSIIDGQHKTTGAHLRGLTQVPCAIVEAPSIEEQSDSFKFLNANTTKVLIYDIYKADLAAKEPYATNINRIAKRANVKLVASRVPIAKLKQGECRSYKTFEANLRKYKETILVKALSVLSINPTSKGCLNAVVIGALCELFKRNPAWSENHAVDMALSKINFMDYLSEAAGLYRKENSTQKAVITRLIYEWVTKNM